jgi:hypothetical protein
MAEKRKPCLILMLRVPGKKGGKKWNKVELFCGDQWEGFVEDLGMPLRPARDRLYRLRTNGKWNDKINPKNKKWFTKWQFRDLLFRSLRF